MASESTQAEITVSVHACSGATESARLAQDVATRLERLMGDGTPAMRVIAVDGCSSACASRQLAGQGVAAEAVSLEAAGIELGGQLDEPARAELASQIATRLQQRRPGSSAPPRRRPDPPAPGATSATATHTVDDYLFAISLLTSQIGACGVVASDVPTLASHVARALGVSRATSGEMLGRLEEDGRIERAPDKSLVLTERGRQDASRVVARHRVVERFLTDSLGYTAGEAHALALGIRGSFPDDAVTRLRELALPATTCPHGWPLDPGTGIEEAPDLVSLSALAPGDRRAVAALAEHDGQMLARLCDLGLLPGTAVEVVSCDTIATTVATDAATISLEPAEAAAVLVLLQPDP